MTDMTDHDTRARIEAVRARLVRLLGDEAQSATPPGKE